MTTTIVKKDYELDFIKYFSRMQCGNCLINSKCTKFRAKYKKIKGVYDAIYTKEYEKILSKPINAEYKEEEKDQLKKFLANKLKLALKETTEICKYENDIIDETFKLFENKIDFNVYPELITYTEQIIKLKVQDFRLNTIQKQYGIAYETENSIKLTPGLHYSMEVSKQVGDIIEKMNKILYGEKHFNTNVNVDISQAIIDAYDERVNKMVK